MSHKVQVACYAGACSICHKKIRRGDPVVKLRTKQRVHAHHITGELTPEQSEALDPKAIRERLGARSVDVLDYHWISERFGLVLVRYRSSTGKSRLRILPTYTDWPRPEDFWTLAKKKYDERLGPQNRLAVARAVMDTLRRDYPPKG